MRKLIFTLFFLALSLQLSAKIIYVNDDAVGSDNGTSWVNAYNDLQDALTEAVSGDTIAVAAGTYVPGTSQYSHFILKSGVKLLGGFAGSEVISPSSVSARDFDNYETILSGDLDNDGIFTDNSYHVVYGINLREEVIFDGFTVEKGYADDTDSDIDDEDFGGGMLLIAESVDSTKVSISNVIFKHNKSNSGGGLAIIGRNAINEEGSTVRVRINNSLFIGNEGQNTTVTQGGALYISASLWADMNVSIDSSRFEANILNHSSGTHYGGAAYVRTSSDADAKISVKNTIFCNNQVQHLGYGAAVFFDARDGSSITGDLTSTTFTRNAFTAGQATSAATINVDEESSADINLSFINTLLHNTDPNVEIYINDGTPILEYSYSMVRGSRGSLGWNEELGSDKGNNLDVDPGFGGDDCAGQLLVFSDLIGAGDGIHGSNIGYYQGAGEVPQNIVYVDQDATGNNNGASWTDAYTNLQTAMVSLNEGDIMLVAAGEYRPDATDRTVYFDLVSGTKIYGGFAGNEIIDADLLDNRDLHNNASILSGDLNGDDGPGFTNYDDNTYHVVYGNNLNNAIFDGFWVTNGYADGSGDDGYGGGIYLYNSDITLSNLLVINNYARVIGAGLNNESGEITIINSTFANNDNELNAIGEAIYAQFSGDIELINSIIFNDGSASIDATNAEITIQNVLYKYLYAYENIRLGNNYDFHPAFVDPAIDDYRLIKGSDAIDAGINAKNIGFYQGEGVEVPGTFVSKATLRIPNTYVEDTSNNYEITFDASLLNGELEVRLSKASSYRISKDSLNYLANDSVLNFTPTAGEITNARFYVQFLPGVEDFIRDTLIFSSAGMNDFEVSLLSRGVVPDIRLVSIPSNRDFGTFLPGEISNYLSFEIDGNDLREDVHVVAPDQFDISLSSSFSTTPDTIVLAQANGKLADTRIYVRFAPDQEGQFKGDVMVYTEGDTVEVSFNGAANIPGKLFVNQAATGLNNGSNWQNAFDNLFTAFNEALPGDTVFISAGTYLPSSSDRGITFEIDNGLTVYGGLSGNETTIDSAVLAQRDFNENTTILSADINVDDEGFVNNDENSYRIAILKQGPAATVLDGLTFSGANSNTSGGALYIEEDVKSEVRNCKFVYNKTQNSGAAIYKDGTYSSTDTLKVFNTQFFNNESEYSGGAIYSNRSYFLGSKLLFVGNKTDASFNSGGALYISQRDAILTNVTFYNNESYNGIIGSNQANFELVNVIMWNNTATNSDNNISLSTGKTATIAYSLIEGSGGSSNWSLQASMIDNGNNIDIDPLLVNTLNEDFRLHITSPALSSGDSTNGSNMGFYQGEGVDATLMFVDKSALDFGPKVISYYSKIDSIRVSALAANTDLTIAAPEGFEVSLDKTTFGTTTTIPMTDAKIDTQFVYLRFSPDEKKLYEGLLSLSVDHDSVFVSLAGEGLDTLVYVSAGAAGADDGSSWINAYTQLHDALASAQYGQTIFVAKGTYKTSESADDEYFILKSGVKLYGGFAGDETTFDSASLANRDFAANASILDADFGTGKSIHVVLIQNVDSTTLIDGFTLQNAFNPTNTDGGGIRMTSGSPRLRNLVIRNNRVEDFGAGIYIGGGSPVIKNVVITNNDAYGSNGRGGGIFTSSAANVNIHNAAIINNKSNAMGGGFYNGGSTYLQLINTTIAGNEITNTFASGRAGYDGYGDSVQLVNVISWDNFKNGSTTGSNLFTSGIKISHSILQGTGGSKSWNSSSTDLGNNFDVNPLLKDLTNGNIDLIVGSLALMKGDEQYGNNIGFYQGNGVAGPDPIFVKADATGAADGTSWTDAYTTIYEALSEAPLPATIYVAQGTYQATGDTDINQSLELAPLTRIYGGFEGTETDINLDDRDLNAHHTIIEGDINNSNDASGNTIYPFSLANADSVVIDGFIIQHSGAFRVENSTFRIHNVQVIGKDYSMAGLAQGAADINSSSGSINGFVYINAEADLFGEISAINLTNSDVEIKGALISDIVNTYSVYGISNNSGSNIKIINTTITDIRNTLSSSSYTPFGINHSGDSLWLINTLVQDVIKGFDGSKNSLHVFDNRYAHVAHSNLQGSGGSLNWNDDFGTDGGKNIDKNPLFVDSTYTAVYQISGILGTGDPDYGSNIGYYQGSGVPIVEELYLRASATGNNDGTSWANAFTDLHTALEASTPGTMVYIAEGIYKASDSDREATFTIPAGVRLYGGFAGNEADINLDSRDWRGRQTIISGEIGDAAASDNIKRLITMSEVDSSTVLDGLIMENAYSDASGSALYLSDASPIIRNTIIRDNVVNWSSNGGALYLFRSSPILDSVFFYENLSRYGGAMYIGSYSSPKVKNSTFYGNKADSRGGALYINTTGHPAFINCTFTKNTRTQTFYEGAVAYIENSDSTTFINALIFDNDNNESVEIQPDGVGLFFSHSIVENAINNDTWNTDFGNDLGSNLSENPVFAYPDSLYNVELVKGSPAIGAGDPAYGHNIGSYGGDGIEKPTIFVSTSNIDLGAHIERNGYVPFQITVSGEFLEDDVQITVPGYVGLGQDSLNPIVLDTIILPQDNGTLADTTLQFWLINDGSIISSPYTSEFKLFTAQSDTIIVDFRVNIEIPAVSIPFVSREFFTDHKVPSSVDSVPLTGENHLGPLKIYGNIDMVFSLQNDVSTAVDSLFIAPQSDYSIDTTIYFWYYPVRSFAEYNFDVTNNRASSRADLFYTFYQKNNQSYFGEVTGYIEKPTHIFVDEQSTVENGFGESWENAFNSLQDALDIAQNGDTIFVAAGIYYTDHLEPSLRNATFRIKEGVKVFGGFEGNEHIDNDVLSKRDFINNETILSGDLARNDADSLYGDNAFHVVTIKAAWQEPISEATVLDGFTITGGNADNNSNGPDARGGAIKLQAGAAADCKPTLRNLVISNNHGRDGAGIQLETLGGAQAENSPYMENIWFVNNIATRSGAALYVGSTDENPAYPECHSCLFVNNHSGLAGAAIYVTSGNSIDPGISRLTLSNTTLLNNTSGINTGNAIYANSQNENCTSEVVMTNTIVWGNQGNQYGELEQGISKLIAEYSIIKGSGGSSNWNTAWGDDLGNNFDTDPVFAPGNGELFVSSPAIGTGNADIGNNIGYYQGTGLPTTPFIVVSRSSIDFGKADLGSQVERTYIVNGAYLENEVTITADNMNVLISATHNGSTLSGQQITISPVDGVFNNLQIRLEWTPDQLGSSSAQVIHSSADFDDVVTNLSIQALDTVKPKIYISENRIDYGSVPQEETHIQSFTILGEALQGVVELNPYWSVFKITLDAKDTIGSNFLSLDPLNGILDETTIYVLFNPSYADVFESRIGITSTNMPERSVPLIATSFDPTQPFVNAPNIVQFDDLMPGDTAVQIINVSGRNLQGMVEAAVTSGSNFAISIDGLEYFNNSARISLATTDGVLDTTRLYVRFVAGLETFTDEYFGTLSILDSNLAVRSISLNGNKFNRGFPEIFVTPNEFSFKTIAGAPSEAQSMQISGNNLTTDMQITVGGGLFEVSPSGEENSWDSTLTLQTDANGVVPATTVFFRYVPDTVGYDYQPAIISTFGSSGFFIDLNGWALEEGSAIFEIEPASVNFDTLTVGLASDPQSLALSGSNITGSIRMYDLSNTIEFALDQSGPFFGGSLIVPYDTVTNILNRTEVYIRTRPTEEGDRLSVLNIEMIKGEFESQYLGSINVRYFAKENTEIPYISAQPALVEFDPTPSGEPSTSTYNIMTTGFNLSSDLQATVSGPFLLTDFTNDSLTAMSFSPVDGQVDTEFGVYFAPDSEGEFTGSITLSSSGAEPVVVRLSGEGVPETIPPNISIHYMEFGNVMVGTYSLVQSYQITGGNLEVPIDLNCSGSFDISLDSVNFGSTLSIAPTDSLNQTVYVRFDPEETGTAFGSISHSILGISIGSVLLEGKGIDSAIPFLAINPNSIDFGQVSVAEEVIDSYNFMATDLQGSISISSSNSAFRISLDGSEGPWNTNLSIEASSGEASGTIFLNFMPSSPGVLSATITHTTDGLDMPVLLEVSGMGQQGSGEVTGLEQGIGHIKLYPNPSINKSFNLVCPFDKALLMVYSSNGVLVQTNAIVTQGVFTVDANELVEGIYHIKLISDNSILYSKIEIL